MILTFTGDQLDAILTAISYTQEHCEELSREDESGLAQVWEIIQKEHTP